MSCRGRRRVRADRADDRAAAARRRPTLLGPGDDAALVGARRTAGSWPAPTCWSRAGTSAGTGRAPPTSATGRPRPTSPTSPRWAPSPTALLVALCVPPDLDAALGRAARRRAGAPRRRLVGAARGRRRHVGQPDAHHRGHRARRPARAGRRCCAPAPGRATWSRWPAASGYAAAGYTVLSRGFRSPKAARRGVPAARGAVRGRAGRRPGSAPPR